jgi:uncharacterized protein YecE (DUF72 family)
VPGLAASHPFQSPPSPSGQLYWRLHGKGGYRYRYTDEDLAGLRALLRSCAAPPGPHYVVFNSIYARQDALRFRLL